MKKITLVLYFLFFVVSFFANAQHAKTVFSRQDSLRGSLRQERNYDVSHYYLNVKVNITSQSIEGSNTISYQLKEPLERLQVDLVDSFNVDSIVLQKPIYKSLEFEREGNVIWVNLPKEIQQEINITQQVAVFYNGKPRNAVRPPWDGGFTWFEQANNKPWVTLSCQGLGASSWFPLKDHLSDEPDSMTIDLEVPKDLVAVSNGKLVQRQEKNNNVIYTWKVTNPINSYNITLNIGDYVNFSDVYVNTANDTLLLDYYVLRGNEEKAKPYFESQVKPMLIAFEKLFGNYPFYEDSYKLVETPYWGMEHQSCVAYGNNYKLNPFGFDFIILHESGHEWFGNSISIQDNAELWIHEAFTTYSEALFVEHYQGLEKAIEYLQTQKTRIQNKESILAPFGVNYHAHSDADMYFKGTWLLHTLRSVVANDSLWMASIRDFYQTYKHSQPTTTQVLNFFSKATQKNLTPIFEEYLNYAALPVLEYEILTKKEATPNQKTLRYRYNTQTKLFKMPIEIRLQENSSFIRLDATTEWQEYDFKSDLPAKKIKLNVNEDRFLVEVKRMN